VTEQEKVDPQSVPHESASGASADVSALTFTSISKAFPGVLALSDVTLDVRPGEVHAIVGENGAGKSTLMAIASGAQTADVGQVLIAGAELTHASPNLARSLGLAIVRQEPALMPDLSIAENLAAGVPRSARPRWGDLNDWAVGRLENMSRNRTLDPRTQARSLDPAARFIVEISKAIRPGLKVLLLDEPTESLGVDEIEILFAQVRELADSGTAVVYISHRIPDVLRISDRISVLRDGVLHGTFQTSEVTEDQIVQGIVGTPLEFAFPDKRAADLPLGEPMLSVRGFHGDSFGPLDFDAYPGELIGISGVEGNGQRQTIRALAGLVDRKGQVLVDGKPVALSNASKTESAGFAYLPADRKNEGILPSLGVRENINATTLSTLARFGFMVSRRDYESAKTSAESLDVKTATLDTQVSTLSGGNQQKVVIARALLSKPRVILAHEPTQGVDVGARLEIYRLLRAAVDDGATAVVVSSDAAELEGLCDRVLVMSRGVIARELTGADVTEHNMTQIALTATVGKKVEAEKAGGSPLRRFLGGDFAPGALVLAVTVLLGLYTSIHNARYLSAATFNSLLTLFAIVAFAAMAQQVIMLTGGIDLSVGPLMTFLLVLGSFVLVPGQPMVKLLLALLLLVVVAALVGVANWFPSLFGIPAFLVTLVTFTALQGLSFLLRPTYGGSFDEGLLAALSSSIFWLPWAAVAALVVAIALEFVLRRTSWGAQLRAIGSGERAAHEVGIRVHWVRLSAHLLASILVFLAALLLMAQVGSGDASVGSNYTLVGITAAVLGGASIFGGRGSLLGAFAGALLLQQINTATVFLGFDTAWQYFLLGGLTLAAAGFYSKVRGGGARG